MPSRQCKTPELSSLRDACNPGRPRNQRQGPGRPMKSPGENCISASHSKMFGNFSRGSSLFRCDRTGWFRNAYFDAGDKGIGGISDDTIRRSNTGDNLDGLAEITTHLDLPQFDRPVGSRDSDLQTFRAKEQSI